MQTKTRKIQNESRSKGQTASLSEAEIRNVVNGELQDFKEKLQKNGCLTAVGCFKGKEHDNYINGKLRSTLNDMEVFIGRQNEINKTVLDKFEVAANFSMEAATASHASAKLVQDFKEDTKDIIAKVVDDLKQSNRTILFSFIGALVLMLVASLWGSYTNLQSQREKIKQDDTNQIETSRNLKQLIELLQKEK